MSVNTELQNLLTKMGGTPLESDSNSDLIKKISNAYDGSGGGPGGSSGPIYFDIHVNEGEESTSENPTWVADKTYAEAIAAYRSGKVLRMIGNLNQNGIFVPRYELSFSEYYSAGDDYPEGLSFEDAVPAMVMAGGGGLGYCMIGGSIDETGVYIDVEVLQSVFSYPEATINDLGKVLTLVQSGPSSVAPAWVVSD